MASSLLGASEGARADGDEASRPGAAAGCAAGDRLSGMDGWDPKADLHRYLQAAREALLWKLDGLSEYEVRRPMVPTGTNLLGLVKHVAGVEVGYFGETFGRPFDQSLPWLDDGAEPNADMWATADESREEIVDLYHRACAHSDATIDVMALDAVGHVRWWPDDRREVTLHRVLVHVVAETNRHAGHADIVRELIDGAAGLRDGNDNMASGDRGWWAATGAGWSEWRKRPAVLERGARSLVVRAVAALPRAHPGATRGSSRPGTTRDFPDACDGTGAAQSSPEGSVPHGAAGREEAV